jgi:hypothetical protein
MYSPNTKIFHIRVNVYHLSWVHLWLFFPHIWTDCYGLANSKTTSEASVSCQLLAAGFAFAYVGPPALRLTLIVPDYLPRSIQRQPNKVALCLLCTA